MKTPLTFYLCSIIFLLPFIGNSQLVTISGKITSFKDGTFIKNADILECKSKTGTISDKNGFYQLILSSGTIDLLISNDGFLNYSQKFNILSDTTISIILKPVHSLKNKSKTETDLKADSSSEKVENRQQALK